MANDSTNLCECGCGEVAGVYASHHNPSGIVKGQPKRFIHGHHTKLPQYQQQAAPFDQSYTIQPDGCWHWKTINDGDDGYGKCTVRGRKISAHRLSYERIHGPIPEGARIDHTCHDPKRCRGGVTCPHRSCVNPDHLELVTHAENCRRGANAKLTMEQATEIRQRRAAGERGVDLAREFGVQPTTISWITKATRKTWDPAA